MTKHHDDVEEQTTAVEATDSLKAWLASPAQGDTHAAAPEAASGPENTPSGDAQGDDTEEDAQEGTQEPQEEPGDHQREDDTPAAPEAASGPENTPSGDAQGGLEELQRAYADLQAKLTDLEAREAARIEAEEKSRALTAAGIKGDYGQFLTGSKESWGSQIDLLKQFAAENAPAISVPRDPAVDADLEPEEKEITAEDFLKGTHNSL